MKLVTTRKQVAKNLLTLEAYRTSSSPRERRFYVERIREGTCFLIYHAGNQLLFGPSRFIGYMDNDLNKHNRNISKYGGDTNSAIESIYGPFMPNTALDATYGTYCAANGIPVGPTNRFGNPRRYIDYPKGALLDLLSWSGGGKTSATERHAQVAVRLGQDEFRSRLCTLWNACSVTDCTQIDMLRASHIKPWNDSNNSERLDQYNGLLLIPNLDLAFDKGYISFKGDGNILISSKLDQATRATLGIRNNMRLRTVHSDHIPYLAFHGQNVFIT